MILHNHERILVKLIEQYHGLVPSQVAHTILAYGSISLQRAVVNSSSRLARSDFLRGLEKLIRCNLVKISGFKRHQLLEALPDVISHIAYYPQYSVCVEEMYGVESKALVSTLMLYGQLSENELVGLSLFPLLEEEIAQMSSDDTKAYIETFHNKLTDLKQQKLIIQSNGANVKQQTFSVEVVFESLKNRLRTNQINIEDIFKNHIPVWTLNHEALSYLLFIRLFNYFLKQTFPNEEACFVFNMLLKANYEKTHCLTKVVPLSFNEIFGVYHDKYPQLNMAKLPNILRMFSTFFAPNFIQVDKTSCQLNFERFLEEFIKIIIKEFVKKNFGENAVKIFGALFEQERVFENTLLGMLKISGKDLYKCLYHLDQHRMININFYAEPNQSNMSAKNVKKIFSTDLGDVVNYIMKRCHYSLYTLLHRRHIEMGEHKELVARKVFIESLKAQIELKMMGSEEKESSLQRVQMELSEGDHKRASTLLTFEEKVARVEYHLVNYIFLMNTWREIVKANRKDEIYN